jgi:hypothetical protein
MENNETLEQAAARETLEEANARVEIGDLYAVYSLPHISQVYILFRARLLDLDFKPGIESLDVKLVIRARNSLGRDGISRHPRSLETVFQGAQPRKIGISHGCHRQTVQQLLSKVIVSSPKKSKVLDSLTASYNVYFLQTPDSYEAFIPIYC